MSDVRDSHHPHTTLRKRIYIIDDGGGDVMSPLFYTLIPHPSPLTSHLSIGNPLSDFREIPLAVLRKIRIFAS